MEKKVKINVRSTLRWKVGDPEEEVTETEAEATLDVREGMYSVYFSEFFEGAECRETYIYTDGRLTVHRTGAINSTMGFSEGEEFKLVYKTGGMSFDMTTYTNVLKANLTIDGGEIYLNYDMNIANMSRECDMTITVKP